MIKKCGILTFHYTDNPGSVLQAYALQKILQLNGINTIIINYQKKKWKKLSARKYYMGLKAKFGRCAVLLRPFITFLHTLRRVPYRYFIKTHMTVYPKHPLNETNLSVLNEIFDAFIVGSDQIWNLDNVKVDKNYYLSFAEESKRKIAYAASFGVNQIQPENEDAVRVLLKRINSISVREEDGAKIVNDLIGITPSILLDPSLLLTSTDWFKVAKNSKTRGYIFVYLREESKKISDYVERLSQETGLSVVQVTGLLKKTKIGKRIISPGPSKWLGYLANAGIVVTNSFHGIAFSINFNKQFYVDTLKGSQSKTNSRIINILQQFGLENRIVDYYAKSTVKEDIDYCSINRLLENKREQAIKFLKESLE